MSTVAHADAVLAALVATGATVYEQGEAPEMPTPPFSYAVVYSDLGRDETFRMNGPSAVTAYRVPVQVVGSTANNARVVADKVLALRGTRLTVAGTLCTPCYRESSVPIRLDDTDPASAHVGTITLTFASSPTA